MTTLLTPEARLPSDCQLAPPSVLRYRLPLAKLYNSDGSLGATVMMEIGWFCSASPTSAQEAPPSELRRKPRWWASHRRSGAEGLIVKVRMRSAPPNFTTRCQVAPPSSLRSNSSSAAI